MCLVLQSLKQSNDIWDSEEEFCDDRRSCVPKVQLIQNKLFV